MEGIKGGSGHQEKGDWLGGDTKEMKRRGRRRIGHAISRSCPPPPHGQGPTTN
jgi:hypothetical protein